jgi:TonB family protein
MLRAAFICGLIFCSSALAQEHANPIGETRDFAIGRLTFFDFGPPFNYYEIVLVHPTLSGVSVKRILLTPSAGECPAPAKIEIASGTIAASATDILGSVHPCTIPENKVRKEAKRCKKCLVFSGAQVTMQFQCGANQRLIHSSVLDRDWFDPSAKTPQYTSWSMELLARLEEAVDPGVMSKPAFDVADPAEHPAYELDPLTAADLAAGKFDALFSGKEKPSQLYRAATAGENASPTVSLKSSDPFEPELFVAPVYPKLAMTARVEGSVSLQLEVDADGHPMNVVVIKGHPLLRAAALEAASGWKFPRERVGQTNRMTVEFNLNCHRTVIPN